MSVETPPAPSVETKTDEEIIGKLKGTKVCPKCGLPGYGLYRVLARTDEKTGEKYYRWSFAHSMDGHRLNWCNLTQKEYLAVRYPGLDIDDRIPPGIEEVSMVLIDPASNRGLAEDYVIVGRRSAHGEHWYRFAKKPQSEASEN